MRVDGLSNKEQGLSCTPSRISSASGRAMFIRKALGKPPATRSCLGKALRVKTSQCCTKVRFAAGTAENSVTGAFAWAVLLR